MRLSHKIFSLRAHTKVLGLCSLKIWYCVDQILYEFLCLFFFSFKDIVIFDIVFFFILMTFYNYSLLLLFEHIHRYTHTSIDDIKWCERYVTKFRSADLHELLPPMLRVGIDETWCFMAPGDHAKAFNALRTKREITPKFTYSYSHATWEKLDARSLRHFRCWEQLD